MWHVFCYIRRQKILNQRDVVMRENLLKKKIQNGESAIGTFVKLTDPAVPELLALAGLQSMWRWTGNS